MRWLRVLVIAWVGGLEVGAQDAKKTEPAIDLALARRAFAEAEALSKADRGKLWGKPLYGPMMFADPSSRQIVANERDRAGSLGELEGLWVGTLPADQNIANTAFNWNGTKWTMVMWPLQEDRYARGRLMLHELFHRIQDDLGLPATDSDNRHLAHRDGRTWLRMEWRALREALIREGDERVQAIADALVFRAYRRSLFPKAAEAERLMELNEGLAEYTGFRLSGLPPPVLADRAAVHLAQHDVQPTFVRNFAYASGPAYGILLDATGIDWRRKLSVESDLGELLREAMKIKLPGHYEDEAKKRSQLYDDGRVFSTETRRHENRERLQARFRARFIDGPVLELPADKEFKFSFDPNGVEAMDQGPVYLTTRVSDEWGALTVSSGGALLLRDAQGRAIGFRVPAPTESNARPLKGDGWTLELTQGWTLTPGERPGDWKLTRAP
jgi:hypothetical protein